MVQLGLERAQRPLAEVVVEVGDHADGVRQPGALVEGAAALVVDEHEDEVVGADPRGHAGDEGAQQLALARAGGAADEPVRPVGHEVELDDTVLAAADRGAQGRVGEPERPPPQQVVGGHLVEGEQRQQPHELWEAGADDGQLRILEPCQGAGAPASGGVVEAGDGQLSRR